jgi:hypothetical protein
MPDCPRQLRQFYVTNKHNYIHTYRAIAEVKQSWSVIGWATINLMYPAPPCFGRHVKLLLPAAFAVVSTNQHALDPRGGLWPDLIMIHIIHEESLCPSSGDTNRLMMMIYTQHTRYPWRGSRGISDVRLTRPRLPKLISYEEYCRRDRW